MGMLEYMLASGERHLITDEELAVIEAAKALHAKMSRGEFASTANEQALVWQAVEALQEVEDE